MTISTVRIQIAGISSLEDALAVERAGADAIGFTVGLPRGPHNGLDEWRARDIIRALPPFIVPTLITYNDLAVEVIALCRTMGVNTVQLHGGAEPSQIERMRESVPGLKVILPVHITGPEAIDCAAEVESLCDAIILDTRDPKSGRTGATGLTHDWSVSAEIVRRCSRPVILAGGLTPENVAEAIEAVRPWAVDVHTGVERPDGTTDHDRVRAFVKAARRVVLT
ncbi:MAG: hypothetical protein Kow0010_25700 [Dehalococcoidia bacterium]